jgi:O-antigen ligase
MLLPFFFYMYRLQNDYKVGLSSNENRLLSFSIATDGFFERPLVGHGSGEFINIISDNIRYVSKFGNPPDAFGFWQKILVENGIFGLAFFMIFSLTIMKLAYDKMGPMRERSMILYLSAAALSVYIFEMTNVSYYTGKMWLPVGMLLTAITLKIPLSRRGAGVGSEH